MSGRLHMMKKFFSGSNAWILCARHGIEHYGMHKTVYKSSITAFQMCNENTNQKCS